MPKNQPSCVAEPRFAQFFQVWHISSGGSYSFKCPFLYLCLCMSLYVCVFSSCWCQVSSFFWSIVRKVTSLLGYTLEGFEDLKKVTDSLSESKGHLLGCREQLKKQHICYTFQKSQTKINLHAILKRQVLKFTHLVLSILLHQGSVSFPLHRAHISPGFLTRLLYRHYRYFYFFSG